MSSTPMPNYIRDTDIFILQRPSTYTGGSSSSDIYSVSAEQLGNFLTSYANIELKEIKELLDDLDKEIKSLKTGIDQALVAYSDLNDRVVTVERISGDNYQRLNQLDQDLEDTLARAKINFYHELQDSKQLEPGQASVWKSDTALAKSFSEVKKIRYHAVDPDGKRNTFDNVFRGETLEITCFANIGQTLTHRAVYIVKDFRIANDNNGDPSYYDVDLEIVNFNGNVSGLPFYNQAEDNPIRSDFYPITDIVTPDEISDLMDGYMPLVGDHKKEGKLTIAPQPGGQRAKLTFEATQGVDVVYEAILKFKNKDSQEVMTLSETVVNIKKTLKMNSLQIKNLAGPTEATDAANKRYVDEALEQFDITQEDLFKPGDQVAVGAGADRAEVYGFYVQGGSLYFKTGTGS